MFWKDGVVNSLVLSSLACGERREYEKGVTREESKREECKYKRTEKGKEV